jgi:hypothetical protein
VSTTTAGLAAVILTKSYNTAPAINTTVTTIARLVRMHCLAEQAVCRMRPLISLRRRVVKERSAAVGDDSRRLFDGSGLLIHNAHPTGARKNLPAITGGSTVFPDAASVARWLL